MNEPGTLDDRWRPSADGRIRGARNGCEGFMTAFPDLVATTDENGLIVESRGHVDAADDQRQFNPETGG